MLKGDNDANGNKRTSILMRAGVYKPEAFQKWTSTNVGKYLQVGNINLTIIEWQFWIHNWQSMVWMSPWKLLPSVAYNIVTLDKHLQLKWHSIQPLNHSGRMKSAPWYSWRLMAVRFSTVEFGFTVQKLVIKSGWCAVHASVTLDSIEWHLSIPHKSWNQGSFTESDIQTNICKLIDSDGTTNALGVSRMYIIIALAGAIIMMVMMMMTKLKMLLLFSLDGMQTSGWIIEEGLPPIARRSYQ